MLSQGFFIQVNVVMSVAGRGALRYTAYAETQLASGFSESSGHDGRAAQDPEQDLAWHSVRIWHQFMHAGVKAPMQCLGTS